MMTIGDLSALTHVSIRTLRHYDQIGLLKPSRVTEAGYRQYDESALQRLHTVRIAKPHRALQALRGAGGGDGKQEQQPRPDTLHMRNPSSDWPVIMPPDHANTVALV